jgi:hypothetical protein
VASNSPQAPATSTVADAAQATTIATSIRNAILAAPTTATQGDLEAQIVFAIDQAGAPVDLALRALAAVDRTGLSDPALAALANVTANRSRLARVGTGAIAGGPSTPVAFDSAYSLGGGSSDYTQ